MYRLLLPVALVAIGLSGNAVAQDKTPDVAVSYGDLDLTTTKGVSTLDRRLDHAIAASCPSDGGIADMDRLRSIRECRATKRQEVASLRSVALANARIAGKAVASAAR
jgi:UrcA family protein